MSSSPDMNGRLTTVCLSALVLYLSGMALLTTGRDYWKKSKDESCNSCCSMPTTSPRITSTSRKMPSGHVDGNSNALDVNSFTDHQFPKDAIDPATDFLPSSASITVAPIVQKLGCKGDVIVIGIAGGSGSGKTTLANAIYKAIGKENISFISHDSYYKDLSHKPMEEREKNNFDHPDSLETSLLIEHVKALKNRQDVEIPTYDFSTHSRCTETELLQSKPVVLVEGILIFADPVLCNLLDIRIYVDTDDDIRFIRRVSRDTKERGRTLQGVIDQYINTVRPMHLQFVEPSKRIADIIVPVGLNSVALDLVVSRLKDHLS